MKVRKTFYISVISTYKGRSWGPIYKTQSLKDYNEIYPHVFHYSKSL